MKKMATLFIIASSAFILTGCLTTMTLQGEPPLAVRPGKAPVAAFVMHEYDPGVGVHAQKKLAACLQQRNVFDFVPQPKVDSALSAGGYDIARISGLSAGEYMKIAKATGAEYVIFGNLRVVKALKLNGWRHDIYSLFYLADGKTGEVLDSWRSDTIGAFADPASELDPKKMAESVANHTCAKIVERK